MLVLTDLADWGMRPLDSLAHTPQVKLRLSESQQLLADFLNDVFPDQAAPVAAETPPDAAPGGWAALAVTDEAEGSQYDSLLQATHRPAGLPAPVAALALTGRGFHGNRGRPWRARRGNLHLSCAVPVDLDVARSAAAIPAIPAVAVCDALAICAPGLKPEIKWVNDVLVGGAKTAGVLTAAQSRGQRLTTLVYGVGINVASVPTLPPTLFVPRVTCLHDEEAGAIVELGALCRALLEALWFRIEQLRRDGAAPVVAAYRARCGDIGRRVRVWAEGLPDTDDPATLPPPIASGRVLAMDDDLALHVEGATGPLVGGRLAHLDADRQDREPRR